MINEIFTSRVRVLVGSGLSMAATDVASAKLSSMLANAKIASMQATKLVATKVIAHAVALWMLVMSFIMPIQQTQPVVLHKPAIHRHHRVVAAAPAIKAPIEKILFLHTFEKEYSCVFTGKVSCGDGPCHTATVQIHVNTSKNQNLIKSVAIEPDGSYAVRFAVKGSIHEHLDWWIVADSPDSASKQVQGREIFTEDAEVQVEQPIALL